MKRKKQNKVSNNAIDLSIQSISSDNIVEQIKQVNKLINCADLWFKDEKNEVLIESCIYQREALGARYKYLITVAKQQNLKCEPFKT